MMQQIPNPTNPLLTRPKAAEFLAISQRKLDQLAASGEIPRVRIDACVRFDRADLQAFANSKKEGGER
jgi:excisionase family DNA binding protein